MMSNIVAVLVAAFGFNLIFSCWKTCPKTADKTEIGYCSVAGWTCVGAGVTLLTLHNGLEFGISYALSGLALIPLLIAATNHQRRSSIQSKPTQFKTLSFELKQWVKNIGHFLIAVPSAGLCALLFSLCISHFFAWQAVSQMAFMVLAFPLFWALLAFAYFYTERRTISAALIAAATTLMGGVLTLSN